jgi:transcriptional regulator with XRE-family HTH domain
MKQPELGKKIAELRKAKGLTQEELVEQCKLSVRTLQRIESGGANPRGYTLRAIFVALDYNTSGSFENLDIKSSASVFVVRKWLEQFYLYVLDLFNLKTNTMKKISILSIMTLSVVLTFVSIYSESEAQTTAGVKQIIAQSNKKFIEWFNGGQVDSLVNLYDNNACLVERGCGKEFIRGYFKVESTKYKFQELSTTNLSVNDNVVVETGSWKLIVPTGIALSGNYKSEWMFVNNKWVIVKDIIIPIEK